MTKGKFLTRDDDGSKLHECHKPINWFRLRFRVGAKWQCYCGQIWKYHLVEHIAGADYIWFESDDTRPHLVKNFDKERGTSAYDFES